MQTAPERILHLSGIALSDYIIEDVSNVMTPALAIYSDIVDSNITVTLDLLGGDANRWRPHIKTTKIAHVMRRLVERGIHNFKCSTTLELLTIIEAGASDVLLAYPSVGANAKRVSEIASQHKDVRVSALVENSAQIDAWPGSPVGLFIDVNPGMDRTGLEQDRIEDVVRLAREITSAGLEFRGLHYYDGHLSKYDLPEREEVAHQGYNQLMQIVAAFDHENIALAEIITAGTPAFPCALSYKRFQNASFIHRASPGTVVYSDCTSLPQLPKEWGYRPAAVVVSAVVSQPTAKRITCDAGHKTVSADSGIPTCAVIGRADLIPSRPSEEHLPIDVIDGAEMPRTGEIVYLVPRHVCPTVNNFDHAIIVERGQIVAVERVTARGREVPIKLANSDQ
jgi:D-serine deaminase-like pyridoxal phosphate-dependent protein